VGLLLAERTPSGYRVDTDPATVPRTATVGASS
jgi:hypothetical protein